jgi:hypothetical protein
MWMFLVSSSCLNIMVAEVVSRSLVSRPHDVEPLLATALALGNKSAHPVAQYLAPAPGSESSPDSFSAFSTS